MEGGGLQKQQSIIRNQKSDSRARARQELRLVWHVQHENQESKRAEGECQQLKICRNSGGPQPGSSAIPDRRISITQTNIIQYSLILEKTRNEKRETKSGH